MRMRWIAVLILVLAGFTAKAGGGAELVIFRGDPQNALEKDFELKYLPQIKELAKTQGIAFTEKNVSKGAPENVKFTPAIFFQNHLGRSLFIGRYQALDKIQTFMRTVARMPQAEVTNQKHDVLVWKMERAVVYSPIKLTAPGGDLPQGFDAARFHQEALAAFAKGANKAQFQALFPAQRADRAMYLAIYPYIGSDGKFFLSAEMYSQFNCIEPIYKRFDKPFEGTFKNYQAVMEAAGQALQAEVIQQLSSTAKGDGMVAVPAKTPIKTWEALGLDLPKAPQGAATAAQQAVALGRAWEFGGPVDKTSPVLSLSFLAPMDYYAGEVKTLFGELEFSEGPSLTATQGKFGIETSSLTMGDPGLDEHIKEMIAMVEYPKAYFTFAKLLSVDQPQLSFGTLSQCAIQGELDFMGIKAPVDVIAQFEPILDDQGAARILVNASFQLRLKERYQIDGPDGPSPANDSMQFFLNFLLKPKA